MPSPVDVVRVPFPPGSPFTQQRSCVQCPDPGPNAPNTPGLLLGHEGPRRLHRDRRADVCRHCRLLHENGMCGQDTPQPPPLPLFSGAGCVETDPVPAVTPPVLVSWCLAQSKYFLCPDRIEKKRRLDYVRFSALGRLCELHAHIHRDTVHLWTRTGVSRAAASNLLSWHQSGGCTVCSMRLNFPAHLTAFAYVCLHRSS